MPFVVSRSGGRRRRRRKCSTQAGGGAPNRSLAFDRVIRFSMKISLIEGMNYTAGWWLPCHMISRSCVVDDDSPYNKHFHCKSVASSLHENRRHRRRRQDLERETKVNDFIDFPNLLKHPQVRGAGGGYYCEPRRKVTCARRGHEIR